jgi:hypothetical protein
LATDLKKSPKLVFSPEALILTQQSEDKMPETDPKVDLPTNAIAEMKKLRQSLLGIDMKATDLPSIQRKLVENNIYSLLKGFSEDHSLTNEQLLDDCNEMALTSLYQEDLKLIGK